MIRPMHATFKDCWWCLQELAAIRDALTPPLACAAAKIGDIEALEALKEMVSHPTVYNTHTVSTIENRAPGCDHFSSSCSQKSVKYD